MPSHRVKRCQVRHVGYAPDGGDIPQSFVKGHHVGMEVQGREAAGRAAQPALLLAGWGTRAPDQRIHLQSGVQERIWLLSKQTQP